MNRILNLTSLPLLLTASLGIAACGGINVAPPATTADVAAPVACSTDDDCKSDSCRTGKCDATAKQCTYTMLSGWCFIGGACVLDGQQKPGDLCSVCDSGSTTEVYVSVQCGAGQSCEPTQGCVAEAPDTVVTGDEGPDVAGEDVPIVEDVPVDTPDAADDGVGPVACTTNADCTGKLDTAPCEAALCVAKTCAVATLPAGSACTPEGGTDSACSTGKCDDGGACVGELLSNVGCDDGSACTLGDVCQDGACVGTTKDCSDKNPCTKDSCDAVTGACASEPLPDGGVATPCDDENPCTGDDACTAGTCVGGSNLCACTSDADCPDDGDKCNGVQHCVTVSGGSKGCEVDPATVVTCIDAGDDACHKTACAAATGTCATSVQSGAPCDDGDACTFTDKCDASGACAGTSQECDDANVCTNDSCNGGACVNAPNASPCDDGDPCTDGDACASEACAGKAKACDDGNACTKDACEAGACASEPAFGDACDDGDACTKDDACDFGGCKGTALTCDDGNPCTDDACDSASGCTTASNTATCTDGNPCTVGDVCFKGACKAGAGALECPAGGACQVGACDAATGCKLVAASDGDACDDGDDCTSGDACQAGACAPGKNTCECKNDGDCASNDLCSGVHVCSANKCTVKPGTVVVCPASIDPCLTNECTPATGKCGPVAANEGKSCAADTACTTGQACKGGKCVGTSVLCPEKQCNAVSGCDPANGCLYTFANKGLPCDDADLCTEQDNCNSVGQCVGLAKKCDDGNGCTLDGCKSTVGCTATPVADKTPCEADANLCTADLCSSGKCQLGATKPCDDGVACTVNSCDKATGNCVYTPDNAACNDGNACTTDTCGATGCATPNVIDFTTCTDGDATSSPDFCFQGTCVGGVTTAVSPAKTLCKLTNVQGIDLAQSGADFYTTGNYATASWSINGCSAVSTQYTAVHRLTGEGALQSLGGTPGVSYAMADKVVVGTVVGLVDPAASTVDWASKLKTSLNLPAGVILAATGFAHTYTSKTTHFDHWMIAGYVPGTTIIPFAQRCTHALTTDSWSCLSPGFDTTVGTTKGLSWLGATLATASCGTAGCIGTAIAGDTLTAWASGSGTSVLLGDASAKHTLGLKLAGSGTPMGALQETSEISWHYGMNDLLVRCAGPKCASVTAPQDFGYWDWYGGFGYSGGVVLLGFEAKSGDSQLVFVPSGADWTSPKAYHAVTIQLDAATTSLPNAVLGTTTAGIYVLGNNSAGSAYTIWSFLK